MIKRLANHIRNDDEFAEKEKNGNVGNDERKNARNLVGSLILGVCVCEGFAEAATNVFPCLGIECINIGNDEHMWNQIN